MSYFNIGGNSGYAFGAIVTSLLVHPLGLVGGLLAMVPVLIAAFALTRLVPYLRELKPEPGASTHGRGDDRRRAMALLGGGDRAAQHRLVHAARLRAALGGVARDIRRPTAAGCSS